MSRSLWRIFNAWSQLLSTLMGGEPNESISGRAHRRGWGVRHAINLAFWWQVDHCRSAHLNERTACWTYLALPLSPHPVPARVWWQRCAVAAAVVLAVAVAVLIAIRSIP